MTMQSSGAIFMSQINHEIGLIPDNGNIWMDHDWLRTLAGRPGSGTYIAFSDFYGKSWYIPMNVSATGVYNSNQSPIAATFTANGYPSVNYTGGSGGVSYQWGFNSNPSGFAMANANSQSPTVSHSIPRAGFNGQCTVYCILTDSTGHQVRVDNISIEFYYGNN